MNLVAYRTAIGALLGSTFDASTWTTALLDAALKQALREYDEVAPALELDITVTDAGYEQDLAAGIPDLRRVLAVAWPWFDGSRWHERAVAWTLVDETVVRFWELAPAEGDVLRVRYQRAHAIDDLDGATATTVRATDEGLLVTGAAAWAVDIRLRQLAEEPGAPGQLPDELKRYEDRVRRDWTLGLDSLARVGVQGGGPVWGTIGL